jgi:hypothetical protein
MKVWGTQLNENGRYQAIDLEEAEDTSRRFN